MCVSLIAESVEKVFKEGSSLPVEVRDKKGDKYIVKLKGAGEGGSALITEYLASKIAGSIGFPVLVPHLIMISKDINIKVLNDELYELVAKSIGINLGFKLLENTRIYNEKYDSKYIDRGLKDLIFLYDCFLLNVDRTINNLNILLNRKKLIVFDYGASFLFKGLLFKSSFDENEYILRQLRKHVFYRMNIKEDSLIKCFDLLREERIKEIFSGLPEEWLNENDKKDLRIGLEEKIRDSEYLKRILTRINDLEFESEDDTRERQLKNRDDFKIKFNIR